MIVGATGLSYQLRTSDAGHTIRPGGDRIKRGRREPAPSSAPTGVVTATATPSCTIRAKSANVLLPPTKITRHKRKTRRKPGTLSFVVRCDQAARVTLHGKLAEVVKPKHGKKRHKTFSLPTARGSAHAGVPLTVTIKLPRSALNALRTGAHESVKVTLTAPNVNGITITTATVPRLKPIRT